MFLFLDVLEDQSLFVMRGEISIGLSVLEEAITKQPCPAPRNLVVCSAVMRRGISVVVLVDKKKNKGAIEILNQNIQSMPQRRLGVAAVQNYCKQESSSKSR